MSRPVRIVVLRLIGVLGIAGILLVVEQRASHHVERRERLDHGVKRLMTPHIYHVSLSQKLWNLKQGMIQAVNGDEEK